MNISSKLPTPTRLARRRSCSPRNNRQMPPAPAGGVVRASREFKLGFQRRAATPQLMADVAEAE